MVKELGIYIITYEDYRDENVGDDIVISDIVVGGIHYSIFPEEMRETLRQNCKTLILAEG